MKFTKIKTFEDACKALGYDASVPLLDNVPDKHRSAMIDHYKLVVIIEAINEGWQPDWSNTDERKYFLWPDIIEDVAKPAGFGLAYRAFDYWYTYSAVGSRLCFKDRERAKYCFDTFKDLWENYFLIAKN